MTESKTAKAKSLARLATKISHEHKIIIGKFRSGLQHALKCGELLIAAKNLLPHGEFQTWVEREAKLKERTAQAYMRLANNRAAITKAQRTAPLAELTINGALDMLARPAPLGPAPYQSSPPSTATMQVTTHIVRIPSVGYFRDVPPAPPRMIDMNVTVEPSQQPVAPDDAAPVPPVEIDMLEGFERVLGETLAFATLLRDDPALVPPERRAQFAQGTAFVAERLIELATALGHVPQANGRPDAPAARD